MTKAQAYQDGQMIARLFSQSKSWGEAYNTVLLKRRARASYKGNWQNTKIAEARDRGVMSEIRRVAE